VNKWGGLTFLALLGSFQANAITPGANVANIPGDYRCRGDDFINHKKFDEPTVVTQTGETYHFIWQNDSMLFHGTGILHNQQLSIVYWVPINSSNIGVVTYQVLPNGDLSGKWTTKNGQITGKEYCEKIS
jgi:hypothetical protein